MGRYAVAILLCGTLGLAPFFPEPHLVKQARNFQNGTLREFMDLVDVFLHGVPFLYLAGLVLVDLYRRRKPEP